MEAGWQGPLSAAQGRDNSRPPWPVGQASFGAIEAQRKAEVRAERVSIGERRAEKGFRGEACHGAEAGEPYFRGGRPGEGWRRPGRARLGKRKPAADPRPRKINRYGRYAREKLDEMRVSALLYSIGLP